LEAQSLQFTVAPAQKGYRGAAAPVSGGSKNSGATCQDIGPTLNVVVMVGVMGRPQVSDTLS